MTLLALLVAGCTARNGASFDATTGTATLVIGQQQEPISLNPALENGQRSTQWGELLFSYLLKYDSAGKLVGDVATAVPSIANGGISRDGRTITYHLRKGVRFADGVALTARDCVWSIDAINNRANNVQSRYGYDRIVASDAPNDYTLVLHLRAPFAPILSLVLAPQGFPVLPEHLLAKYPDFNHLAFNAQPIGSGPYVVERWLRNDRVEMRANPYYFLGEPQIRRLVVRFITAPAGGTNQLETHEISAFFNEQDYSQYPILLSLHGYAVLNTPVSAVDALIFNTQGPLTNDPAVRHALAEAIDARSLVAKAYRGALASRDAARGLFLWAFDPNALPDVPYDPAQARARLGRAGWALAPDGIRRKDGRALDLLLVIQAGVPGEAIAANLIVQYERAVGARVTIKQFAVTQFGAPASMGGPVYGGKFDLALYSFVNGDDPDTTDQFACANVPPNGYNKSRICDPRIDALLAAGRETYNAAKRKAIYADLQALLYRQLPMLFLYQRRELDVFPARLRGPSGSVDSVFWDVARWRFVRSGESVSGTSPPAIGNGVGVSLTDSSKTLDWMPRTPGTL
ncbi:MAG TPA: peptide ABC transporter substrate-binding protein [Verrucomicrobiae bacterium]|nr:peptide ABC transporter substrate-binding protein [Verrucomicrobiae bacterium]